MAEPVRVLAEQLTQICQVFAELAEELEQDALVSDDVPSAS